MIKKKLINFIVYQTDISEANINMEYIECGLTFPRNYDIDGKRIFIIKSKLHVRGLRNADDLLRIFIYWMERLNREGNFDQCSIFFDLAGTGLSNMDIDHTKSIINILKFYYPNNLNYIFIYELPWILNGKQLFSLSTSFSFSIL